MKNRVRTQRHRRGVIATVLVLAMMISLSTGLIALAADDDDIRIVWEEMDIDVIITAADRAANYTTVGPFTYVETNTAGSFRYTGTPAEGITVSDLLAGAGIDTLEKNRVITFVASDGNRVSFTWGQLSEPRYHYTYPTDPVGYDILKTGVRGEALPSMISFNQGNSAPRNYMGITYPTEQFRGVMNNIIRTIEIGGFAPTWPSPFVSLEASDNIALLNNSIVDPGTRLRINSELGQGGQSLKYFYTTDGTNPVPGNASTDMFNWNSNAPSPATNPSIVVPDNVNNSEKFVIKAITYGYGRLTSPVMTYTFYYSDYVPPTGAYAFLTGPEELNIFIKNDIEYTVNVANVEDVNVFKVKMSYDAAKLEFDDITLTLPGNLGAWIAPETINDNAGELEFIIMGGARDEAFTTADAAGIANVKFTVKDGLGAGDNFITKLDSVTLFDPVGDDTIIAEITESTVSTSIIYNEIPYDINEDGVYDLLDLSIIIYRFFMIAVADGPALWTEASAYDHLGIGVINTQNIIALYSLIEE